MSKKRIFVYSLQREEAVVTSGYDQIEFFNKIGAEGKRVVHISETFEPSGLTDTGGRQIPKYVIQVLIEEEQYVDDVPTVALAEAA